MQGRFPAKLAVAWARAITLTTIVVIYPLLNVLAPQLVPGTIRWVPPSSQSGSDFSQYYMGGLVAKEGLWQDLYPVKNPAVCTDECRRQNKVGNDCAIPHRHLAMNHSGGLVPAGLLRQYPAASHWSTLYIYPPPLVWLLLPVALLPFSASLVAWQWGLVLLMGWLILLLGKCCRLFTGEPTYLEAAATALFALPWIPYRALSTLNVSVILAVALALLLLGWVHEKPGRVTVGLLIPALFKGFTVFCPPLLAIDRKWRSLALTAAASVALCGGILLVAGTGPFVDFFTRVIPNTRIIPTWQGGSNQGFYGSAAVVLGTRFLPRALDLSLKFLMLGIVACGYCLYWRSRDAALDQCRQLARVSAGLGVCVIAFVAFTPGVWDHYSLLTVPFWGWLIWEISQARTWLGRVVIGLIFPLLWLPARVLALFEHATLWYGHRPIGYLLFMLVGLYRLQQLSHESRRPAQPVFPLKNRS